MQPLTDTELAAVLRRCKTKRLTTKRETLIALAQMYPGYNYAVYQHAARCGYNWAYRVLSEYSHLVTPRAGGPAKKSKKDILDRFDSPN